MKVNRKEYEVESQPYNQAVNHLVLAIVMGLSIAFAIMVTQHSDEGVPRLRIMNFVVVGMPEVLLSYGVNEKSTGD